MMTRRDARRARRVRRHVASATNRTCQRRRNRPCQTRFRNASAGGIEGRRGPKRLRLRHTCQFHDSARAKEPRPVERGDIISARQPTAGGESGCRQRRPTGAGGQTRSPPP
jgi:hypothetical protein